MEAVVSQPMQAIAAERAHEDLIVSSATLAGEYANQMQSDLRYCAYAYVWGDNTIACDRMNRAYQMITSKWQDLCEALNNDCQAVRDNAQIIEDSDRNLAR